MNCSPKYKTFLLNLKTLFPPTHKESILYFNATLPGIPKR